MIIKDNLYVYQIPILGAGESITTRITTFTSAHTRYCLVVGRDLGGQSHGWTEQKNGISMVSSMLESEAKNRERSYDYWLIV